MENTINDKAKAALNRLTAMPGMAAVKDQVEQMVQYSRVAALRKQHRLKAKPHSNHMVFTGNPGTGKTTAARLIGEAFAEIGLLKNSGSSVPFVEISNSNITHPHVGESEKIIARKFKEAKGGVLFIDEAYSLIGHASHNSDMKNVAAIVQYMEDMRDEVLVIAAGYPKDMDKFLKFNAGLASRFPTTIHFNDYSVPELMSVAQHMLQEQEYLADQSYLDALASVMWIERARPDFGNARSVRNHVERSIRKQAIRVSRLMQPSRKDLATLTAQDLDHSIAGIRNTEKDSLLSVIREAQARLLQIDLLEILKK